MVLSVLVARYAIKSSKSAVNRAPVRANGTSSVTTPWVGQRSRRRTARTLTWAGQGPGRASASARAGLTARPRGEITPRTRQQASSQPDVGDQHTAGEVDPRDADPVEIEQALA
ncbi:MAG: hypothetical protein L0H93_05475 [Nocardioides sp.]|nr:hypothetical protein [Nocardioides sp.]